MYLEKFLEGSNWNGWMDRQQQVVPKRQRTRVKSSCTCVGLLEKKKSLALEWDYRCTALPVAVILLMSLWSWFVINTGPVSVFFADPFARVILLNQSQVTEKLEKTLCPTWDQSLIFEKVEIHGEPKLIENKPPEVVIEVFDHDTFVSMKHRSTSLICCQRGHWLYLCMKYRSLVY